MIGLQKKDYMWASQSERRQVVIFIIKKESVWESVKKAKLHSTLKSPQSWIIELSIDINSEKP